MAEYKHGSTTLLVEQDKLVFKHRISDGESLQVTLVSAAGASHVSADWCVEHTRRMSAWWRGAMAAVMAFTPAAVKDLLALSNMNDGNSETEVKCRSAAAHFEVAVKTLLDAYANES